jgi:hypothetical protein
MLTCVSPHARALVAVLEEKRIQRMRPAPKPIDVEKLLRANRRKPKLLAGLHGRSGWLEKQCRAWQIPLQPSDDL